MEEERTERVEVRFSPQERAECVLAMNFSGAAGLASWVRIACLEAARRARREMQEMAPRAAAREGE